MGRRAAVQLDQSLLLGELTGRVRVSTIASGAASVVLPAAGVLERTAPAVGMAVTVREPQASLDAIDDGVADLALIDVYDHVPLALPTHLVVEEVLTEPLVLVCTAGADVPRRPCIGALRAPGRTPPHDRTGWWFISTPPVSSRRRNPWARKMFSPAQIGVLVSWAMSLYASTFSAGTGSSSHIRFNGSISSATFLPVGRS